MSAVRLAFLALTAGLLLASCGGDDDDDTADEPSPLPADRVTFYGADPEDHLGAIVSGDFNHDSVADIAVSAALGDGPANDREDAGEVFIFFGPFESGASLDAGAEEFDAAFYGRAAGDSLGRTLVAADFNADDATDLAMAAPSAAGQAGEVYVMFGGSLAFETDFASADPDLLLTGASPTDFAGLAMAAGQVDDELGADLVIGALQADGPDDDREDAGAVYIVGSESLLAGEEIELAEREDVVHGATAGDRLGEALTVADMSGDGTDDLILAAPFAAGSGAGREAAGHTYVIESPLSLPLDLAESDDVYTIIGIDAGDQLGHSLGAGDTDGDGVADLWLGAVSADGPENDTDLEGEAVLVLGGFPPGGTLDVAADEVASIIYGNGVESRLGRSAAVADLNADERAELVVSAPNEATRAGRVYVYGLGSLPAILTGLDAGDILGHEAYGQPPIGTMGADSDEGVDLLVVAPEGDGPDGARTNAGEAYLIKGTSIVPLSLPVTGD